MSPPAVFIRICDLGIALGWDNISTLPGCQEYQIDSEWWFAINPHGEVTRSSQGARIPPNSIYFKFNGWPAGIVSSHGGMMAAGGLANEDRLLAAIEAAIKRLECPAPAPQGP